MAGGEPPQDSAGGIHVLHVDGDPDAAATAAERLERADDRFAVETATSVDGALDRLGDGVDCVVSGYEIGDRDGIALLEAVREDYPDLPFILFTAAGSEAVASDAISAGVTDYLRKDAGGDRYVALADRIAEAVERSRSARPVGRGEGHLRGIIDRLPHLLYVVDEEERYVLANETLAAFHDTTAEDLEGRAVADVLEPAAYEQFREDLADVLETGEPKRVPEVEVADAAGETHVFEPRLLPYDFEGVEGRTVLGIAADVTERAELEAKLRERSNLLDQLFEQVPTHLFVKDEEGRHVRVSDHYVDTETYAGKTDADITPGEAGRERHADDLRVIETGEPIIDKEEYLPSADEWVLTSKVPRRDDEGEITGLLGISHRITERKEYERELERQNERLAEFAGVVSHDLRNPLNVAQGRLELVADEYEGEHLEAAERALDRMDVLIDDLLTLARQGERVTEAEPVALPEAIARCRDTVETEGVTIEVEAESTVRADEGRLQQLLENLLRNAVEHGEEVTVTVGDLEDGFYVADDGPGIPPEEREQVFEPGYTTDDGGTGFGLPIVNRIAEAHGWEVAVTESEDGGARFEITGVDDA